MSKPTDIEGLEKQMVIDALSDLIKWCNNDSVDPIEIDELTKRNQQRTEYLKSVKPKNGTDSQ